MILLYKALILGLGLPNPTSYHPKLPTIQNPLKSQSGRSSASGKCPEHTTCGLEVSLRSPDEALGFIGLRGDVKFKALGLAKSTSMASISLSRYSSSLLPCRHQEQEVAGLSKVGDRA